MIEKNVYHKLNDYIKASGDLAVKLYKEDIEAALRTKDFGGFELLSLSDYTGQSTATVGILDVFYESKGLFHTMNLKILQVRQYRYLRQREYLKIQIHWRRNWTYMISAKRKSTTLFII